MTWYNKHFNVSNSAGTTFIRSTHGKKRIVGRLCQNREGISLTPILIYFNALCEEDVMQLKNRRIIEGHFPDNDMAKGVVHVLGNADKRKKGPISPHNLDGIISKYSIISNISEPNNITLKRSPSGINNSTFNYLKIRGGKDQKVFIFNTQIETLDLIGFEGEIYTSDLEYGRVFGGENKIIYEGRQTHREYLDDVLQR